MINLTQDQQKAEDMLKKFLASDESFAAITGSAGTGKTFMLQRLAKLCDPEKVICTAPTNKAVKVLRDVIPASIDCVTIHKFLGLGVKNFKDRKVSHRQRDYDPTEWAHVGVGVVDEGSMLGKGVGKLKGACDFIQEDSQEWGRKYILIGDPCQLPPVEGSKKIEAFDMASPEYRVSLKEIVRQAADNPIIKAATCIREAILNGAEPKIIGGINQEEGTGVVLLRKKEWLAEKKRYAENPRTFSEVDFCRTIAWTNEAVKQANKETRETLGADISKPFEIGDTVIVNEAVERGNKVVLPTGEEVVIVNMREVSHSVKEFKGWAVALQGYDFNYPLVVLDPSSEIAFKKELESVRQKCLKSNQWQPFYGLKNYYADLRPPYSLTAHKSQGSTFENVFVNLKDIYSNRRQAEADRCYYVALTRASKKAFVLI